MAAWGISSTEMIPSGALQTQSMRSGVNHRSVRWRTSSSVMPRPSASPRTCPLAGVSVDYYVRMERGSLAGTSESVLDSLATARQLDEPNVTTSSPSPAKPEPAATGAGAPPPRPCGPFSNRFSTRSPRHRPGSATAATTSWPRTSWPACPLQSGLGRPPPARQHHPFHLPRTRTGPGILRRLPEVRRRRRRHASLGSRPQPPTTRH